MQPKVNLGHHNYNPDGLLIEYIYIIIFNDTLIS